jgi:hypothetical protein
MMTLIVRDNQFNTYSGTVSKRFSTTLMPELYSLDKNENEKIINEIIKTYQLEKFDNNHQDEQITLSSYGIYFIDLPKKTILTTDDYGNIKTLLLMEVASMMAPNYITSNKDEFFSSIKKMLEKDYLNTTEEEKIVLLNCIETFSNGTNHQESRNSLEKIISSKFEIELNEEKIGWTIVQENKTDLNFYEMFINYCFDNNITINEVEKANLIYNLKEDILENVDNPDEIESQIENLFFKINTQREKEQLEEKLITQPYTKKKIIL